MADLDPARGTEAGKIRPVLVIQTNLLNGWHGSTLVCPLTSRIIPGIDKLRVHLEPGRKGLEQASDILVDQVRAIDNRRFQKELGSIPHETMDAVSERLRVLMDL